MRRRLVSLSRGACISTLAPTERFASIRKPMKSSGSENLKVAFFLNLAFTIIDDNWGILTNSIAILSDAVHDLGDSLSLGLAWYFERLSRKERSPKHTFGFLRYRLLGGLRSPHFTSKSNPREKGSLFSV